MGTTLLFLLITYYQKMRAIFLSTTLLNLYRVGGGQTRQRLKTAVWQIFDPPTICLF